MSLNKPGTSPTLFPAPPPALSSEFLISMSCILGFQNPQTDLWESSLVASSPPSSPPGPPAQQIPPPLCLPECSPPASLLPPFQITASSLLLELLQQSLGDPLPPRCVPLQRVLQTAARELSRKACPIAEFPCLKRSVCRLSPTEKRSSLAHARSLSPDPTCAPPRDALHSALSSPGPCPYCAS